MDGRKLCVLIMASVVIALAGGGYIIYEWTRDERPPIVKNLRWEPTRIINGKVNDGSVSFTVEDDRSVISSASLKVIPKIYPHLNQAAFPNESVREYVLTPLDGKFDEKLEEFLFTIIDVIGGRGYDILVTAKDRAGKVATANLTTPYIREFENIAPLDDIIVIADYYTWYGIPPHGWYVGSERAHIYMPLLGEYDSADPIVISKHIDRATGHGIDAFAVSWHGWDKDWSRESTRRFEENFLKNPLLKDIKFFILYEGNDRLKIQNPTDPDEKWIKDLDDPFNRERLISDFVYLTRYFSHPSYLKIHKKPMVIFDYAASFRGDIKGVFSELRKKVNEKGYEVYLVNDLAMRAFYPEDIVNENNPHILQLIESTDAIGYGPPKCYLCWDTEITYKAWHDVATKYEKGYLPYSMPGYEPHPVVRPGAQPVPRDPEIFKMLIKLSIKYSTPKMVGIKAFNEWYWGHQIEPAEEYKFTYLEIIKTCLKEFKLS